MCDKKLCKQNEMSSRFLEFNLAKSSYKKVNNYTEFSQLISLLNLKFIIITHDEK